MLEDLDFLRCGRAYSGLAAAAPVKAALLGRTPRYAPDRDFDTLHVALDLTLDFRKREASGTCRTDVRSFKEGLRTLVFDAVDLRVSRAAVDGRPVRFELRNGKLTLRLRRPLKAGQTAQAEVRYRVTRPKAGLHFVYPGPHNPRNPVQVWSQSQPEDARHWFPCHDAPHEKATSELKITVPKGFRAVSNGVLVSQVSRGSTATWHWRMSRPHAIYLISLAAGRFSEVVDKWNAVPVTYYCEKGREEDARRGMGKTVKMLSFFSDKTGVPYPYEKYAQVAVAEYPGGMEHTTATTQTDAVLVDTRAGLDNDMDLLVAHELAHQWFGDLVTCRDWSHAWLNEGFATYFEILFQEHDKGRDEADYELLQNARAYFDEDSRRYRRPIVCPAYKHAWTLFDRHTYEKGAWVLHMLRRELGDDAWWRVMGHYLRRHRDESVETSDLLAALEEVTGRNFKPFFDQWVFKSGYPVLRAQHEWDPRRRQASLWLLQTPEPSEESPLFKLPLLVRYSGRDWTREFKEEVSEREHRWSHALPGEPLNVELDPERSVLKKLTLHKPLRMWRYQLEQGKTAWARHESASHLAHFGDDASAVAITRAVKREEFWGAACEMVRALGGMPGVKAGELLGTLLADKRPKVRRAVVEALARAKRHDLAGRLARLARRDPSLHVAAEACRALGTLRAPGALPLLKSVLRKTSYRDILGSGAAAAIASLRDNASLKALLDAARPPLGFGTRAQALRGLKDYAALSDKALLRLCDGADDPDERLLLVRISTLAQLEDGRALPFLEACRGHANTRVRVFAEEAIARIRLGLENKPVKT